MMYDPLAYYDVSRFTFRALATVVNNLNVWDEEPPTDENNSWAVRAVQKIGETCVGWHVVCDEDGVVDISRSVSFLTPDGSHIEHTVLLKQVDLRCEAGLGFLSSLLSDTIIGIPYVPMRSRKEAKDWAQVARKDASHIYEKGMARILAEGVSGNGWREGDEAERWDVIQENAELSVGHGLGRHKEGWRKVGVVFYSVNVYEDAFFEKASELMSTIFNPGSTQ